MGVRGRTTVAQPRESVRMSAGASRAPSTAKQSASARINLPSASVFVISVVLPFLALITSPGRKAMPEILFSAMGNRHLFVH